MQMQNSTPQGIAGLMQKPQGQSPMPSPAKASPMAGLGSVDDRVSAYMGNTKPLEQRYAMTQDLLDLLALQKIKSQKDAAARQMQMQMAQQQAQNGEAGMTVAQQREKEVTDLTKNELAQQRGETANQQNAEQQAAMQKMMGGVASAPGAAMAAQPQAMAAGGIVGYATGDKVEDPRYKRREGESYEAFRTRIMALAEEDAQTRSQNEQAASAAARLGRAQENDPARLAELQKRGGAAVPLNPLLEPRADPGLAKLLSTVPGANPAISEAQATAAAGPQAAVLRPAPLAPQAPPQAAAPKPPVQPGLPSLPGAAGNPAVGPQVQPGAVGPANDFGTKLEAASLKDAQLNSQQEKLDEEKRVQDKLALTPEQRGVYNEGISGLQKMYQEQYDPERQRQEGLKRFLIGAGGRRYGELAGGAGSAMDYDAAQRASKLKEFGGIQDARTGLIDIDRANVKEGIGAGQKAYEQTSATKRTGLDAGSRLYGEDVKSADTRYNIRQTSRDRELDREVERLRIAATQAATKVQQENLSFDKARSIYGSLIQRSQMLDEKREDNFREEYGMLLMAEKNGKLDPTQKNQLEIARANMLRQKNEARKELEPVLESARQKLGMSSTDGFGDMKKVESKK